MYVRRNKISDTIHIQRVVPDIRMEAKIRDENDRGVVKKEIRETARRIHHLTNKRVSFSVKTL